MKYNLTVADNNDINQLIRYKLNIIFEYANDLPKDEVNRIKKYAEKNVPLQLNNYKMINVENKKVGCLLVEDKDDGVLLDEIYIDEEYRNRKIGSDIIKNILLNNNIVYLWIYKLNKKAISLYKKLRFVVLEETDTRYYMKYEFNK
jgi:ribosomal protein S18 acetylase RimI-like enzyme